MKNSLSYPPNNFDPRLILLIIIVVTTVLVILLFNGCSTTQYVPSPTPKRVQQSFVRIHAIDHPSTSENNLTIKMPKHPKTPHYKHYHYYQYK